MIFFRKKKGQTFIEYSLLLGIVALVLIVLSPMMRRGSSGLVRLVADQVGIQNEADQRQSSGYTTEMDTRSIKHQEKVVAQRLDIINVNRGEWETVFTEQAANLGYSEQ